MSEDLCELGVVGLSSLGQSLAAHHASEKIRVCVGDEDPNFVPQVIMEYKSQIGEDEDDPPPRASRCMLPSTNMAELVSRLARPRKIIVFGTHGNEPKFEEVWRKLCPVLEEGDMVLRWGNEDDENTEIQFYNDSIVGNLSKAEAQPKGIQLLEMVRLERDRTVAYESRGETPDVFMVGGPQDAYEQIEPFISPCALVGHVGNDASCAHFAHMIQRTIENGIMQIYAESTDVLTKAAGFENQDIGRTMKKWGDDEGGRLSGYLLSINHRIFYKRDNISKKGFVTDHIVDSIVFNPVDTWVTLEATKLGIPAPTVNAMLEARFFSAMKDERVEAATVLPMPNITDTPSVMKEQISDDLHHAIYCAIMTVFAECFAIFHASSDVESWDANFGGCIRLWSQPGSFLESKMLEKMVDSIENNPGEFKNLLLVPEVAKDFGELHLSWRRIVALSFASAIPCPTLSASLTYYDTYRARRLPISLTRAQRDFFEASGYDRLDQEGWFTTCWINQHTREMRKKEAAMEYEAEETPNRKRGRNTDESSEAAV